MGVAKKAEIRSVGIVVRPEDVAAVRRARRLAAWLSGRGVDVIAHEQWASPQRHRRCLDRLSMMREADLVAVLGGDGSLLGMARLSSARAAPVVGIHHGDFGFLTDVEGDGPYETMKKILAGDYEVEHRTLLAVTVRRADEVVAESQALNDAVKEKDAKIASLESRVKALEEMVNIDCGSYTPEGVNEVTDLCESRFRMHGWSVERIRTTRPVESGSSAISSSGGSTGRAVPASS